MLTIEDARLYLGIDYEDPVTDANIRRAMATAEKVLLGAVGDDLEQYLPDDPRSKELQLVYLEDLYSQRGVSAKVSGATRRLVHTMELQLKLDLRMAREAAAE